MEQTDEQGIVVGVKMSNLQLAMQLLIDVFHSYSGKEGDKHKLNNSEMKNLLQGEFKDLLKYSKDPNQVETIMASLDENRDGEVDFEEFVAMVALLTVLCNECFKSCPKSCSADQQQRQ